MSTGPSVSIREFPDPLGFSAQLANKVTVKGVP